MIQQQILLFRTPRYREDDAKVNRSVKAGQLKPPSETSFVSIASAYEKSYAFRVGFEFRIQKLMKASTLMVFVPNSSCKLVMNVLMLLIRTPL